MDQFLRDQNRDTILMVHALNPRSHEAFDKAVVKCSEILGRQLNVLIVSDKRSKRAFDINYPKNYTQIKCNTNSVIQLEKALKPYLDSLIAVTCHHEANIPYFINIIPHVPYLATPTEESLLWATDKIYMRRRLRSFNAKLSPAYTIVADNTPKAIDRIEKQVGYPMVVKPAGLAASVLVSVCYHREELEKTLRVTFRRLRSVYKRRGYVVEPKILVEQFMDGEMYSTDIYVNSRGTMYTTPLVHIKTGFKAAGSDDFYGYRRITPVIMKPYKHQAAFDVAKEAVKALALRNTTAHAELMKTPNGWKVIEVGPRMGGFRDFMYEQSYGIDHNLNDLLIRLPMRPIIPRKVKGFSSVLAFYANEQGTITAIKGLKKIKLIESYKKYDINLKKGDKAMFSRNGGGSVVDVYLFNVKRSNLLADIRRLEQTLKIEVSKTTKAHPLHLVSQDTAATETLELTADPELAAEEAKRLEG